jgi:hypothetical protein
MKKKVLVIVLISFIFVSCSRGLTPWQAAQGSQKCGRGYIR